MRNKIVESCSVILFQEVASVRKYISKIKWVIVIQVVFSLLFTISLAFMPYLKKLLFDGIHNGASYIMMLVGCFIGLAILEAVFQYISQVYEWKTDYHFGLLLRSDLFRAIMRRPFSKFRELEAGEYSSVANNDIRELKGYYLDAIIDIIKSSLMLVVYAVALIIFVDYRICMTILAASLVAVFVPKLIAKRLARLKRENQDQLGKYTARFQDFLLGYKLYTDESKAKIDGAHDAALEKAEQARYRFGKFNTFANVSNGFVMDIITISAFAVVGYLFLKGKITVGTGIATFSYIESFIYPIKYIINDINDLNASKEIKEKVFGFLNEPERPKAETLLSSVDKITFDHATVAYEDFVLEDFSYTFEKGKKYAIVGKSGSGKSTIANALMGFAPLQSGHIRINNSDVSALDATKLIKYVDQNEHIYVDSYLNNISLFDTYNPENVKGFLKNRRLPLLNAICDKVVCDTLSGGEKKMLQLMRALVMERPVFVLDEMDAGLDKKSATDLRELVFSLPGLTLIEITHDTSKMNLSRFDYVLEMSNGKIASCC
jgi:ABC-type multidrug transport system, ATPase and permease components